MVLEAQAMERPVVVSDLGAGPEAVLAPPIVPEDRSQPDGPSIRLAVAIFKARLQDAAPDPRASSRTRHRHR